VSPIARSFYIRDQAERCRRLARDCTDTSLRDGLFKLADEYIAQASAQESDNPAVWQAGAGEGD
jgi:hypothetical protein